MPVETRLTIWKHDGWRGNVKPPETKWVQRQTRFLMLPLTAAVLRMSDIKIRTFDKKLTPSFTYWLTGLTRTTHNTASPCTDLSPLHCFLQRCSDVLQYDVLFTDLHSIHISFFLFCCFQTLNWLPSSFWPSFYIRPMKWIVWRFVSCWGWRGASWSLITTLCPVTRGWWLLSSGTKMLLRDWTRSGE